MVRIRQFEFNPFGENCYIVSDGNGSAAIVDPGCMSPQETAMISGAVEAGGLTPVCILLTHAHFDHIYGVSSLASMYGIPVYMHPDDKVILANGETLASRFKMPAPSVDFTTTDVLEGDRINVGEAVFEVIGTPGHTPGGVCYYDEQDKVLFSGDTLFAGSIGRTDSAWGDYDKLITAIMDKVMGIDGDVRVFPGHGPDTDISYERTHNPFLEPFNEKWEDDGNLEGLSLDAGDGM